MNGTAINRLDFHVGMTRGAAGARGGVTLMEVLISIFVLSIGLMSVAALIPVGRFSIVETGKADRSAACGRAGLREVKVRKMLERVRPSVDPPATTVRMWLQPGEQSFNPTSSNAAVVIDPLFVAANGVNGIADDTTVRNGVGSFPYCWNQVTFATGSNPSRVRRLTLRSAPLSTAGVMPRTVADRVFTWQDDLVFNMPEDTDLRPEQLFQYNDGSAGVNPSGALTRQIQGNYSWMVMVTPTPGQPGLCAVSVVVFYKRDFNVTTISAANPKPSERVAVATFPTGGGYGGGDVELSLPSSVTLTGAAQVEYLDIKENTWLMLTNGNYYLWYRVVAEADALVTSATSGRLVRPVTLAGPDWYCHTDPTKTWCLDLDNNGTRNDAQAVICEGVIGVYTQTISLDTAAAWAR